MARKIPLTAQLQKVIANRGPLTNPRAFSKLLVEELAPSNHKKAGWLEIDTLWRKRAAQKFANAASILDYGVEEMTTAEQWRPLTPKKQLSWKRQILQRDQKRASCCQ